jgi:hypothetical protein
MGCVCGVPFGVFTVSAPRKKRAQTEAKVKRSSTFAFRVYVTDPDQRTEIERKAKAVGLSASSYLLMAGLERPERTQG